MIAIDTNILLRFLVQDDAQQRELATQLLEQMLTPEAPGFVTVVAILELDWVLRSQYGFSARIVSDTFTAMMASPNLVFEHGPAIENALAFEHGDFADNVLHETARANGCSRTITFDKRFARLDGVERLK